MTAHRALTPRRALAWSGLLGALVYLGSLANGFAYDDEPIVEQNPVVTQGDWSEAAWGPWWRVEPEVGRLWRPVALTAFTAQWALSGGSPAGFHLVNVLLHGLVSLLVAGLALRVVGGRAERRLRGRGSAKGGEGPGDRRNGSGDGPEGRSGTAPGAIPGSWAALLAGGAFALHPVHVEAVANVVGQAELWAAAGVLGAVHLYLLEVDGAARRALRLGGMALCAAVGVGAKEIAVTLPALLVLAELAVRSPREAAARARRELPAWLAVGVVLAGYFTFRWLTLGELVGEEANSVFLGTDAATRVWTALAVVPVMVRLMVLPFDLVADYDPAVLTLAGPGAPMALVGAVLLVALAGLGVVAWRRWPLAGLGVLWTLVAWSPVSNLVVGTGVLLAERTLYLPSVGAALVLGAAGAALLEARGRRVALTAAAAVASAFLVRTATRVPVWQSTFTVHETLVREHPESWRADRTRAVGLLRVGDTEAGLEAFELAAAKVPFRYGLLTDRAEALREHGRLGEARQVLERAVQVAPYRRRAWQELAQVHLLAGRMRDAHRVAAEGLIRAGNDAVLWRSLSEAYVGAGFLEAAIRARRTAMAVGPETPGDRARLAELEGMEGG